MAVDVSVLLKDIEFGPADRKVDAIGALRQMNNVDLPTVRPVLEKVITTFDKRSVPSFYAACALAALGDNRDLVVDALVPFMYGGNLDNMDGSDDLVYFPWAKDYPPGFHADAHGILYVRRFSPQVATIEAFGSLRNNDRAAQALVEFLQKLGGTDWRLFAIYSAGANGHPSLRQTLEYLRDREPGSVEADAARISLEHFGTSTLFEIAQFHGLLGPAKKAGTTAKSGCFIATAVYGDIQAPELKILEEFRDKRLLRTRLGKAFVRVYYLFSPAAANCIRNSERGKKVIRQLFLRPVIWFVTRR